jgi:hypothetical protein
MVIDRDGAPRAGRTTAVACACLIAVAGCASTPAPQPTTNPPTAAPIFESDEEALAAATEAYANYLATYDAYWAGNATKNEYLDLSIGAAHEAELESMGEWEQKGWRAVGTSAFDSISLQSVSHSKVGWKIRTYLCADASKGDVVNAEGVSVAPPQRPLRLPLEIEFTTSTPSPFDLRISESRVWSGTNFC